MMRCSCRGRQQANNGIQTDNAEALRLMPGTLDTDGRAICCTYGRSAGGDRTRLDAFGLSDGARDVA